MKNSVYLSNISPVWPFSRQEQDLAEALSGWPKDVRIYRDTLHRAARQAHRSDDLSEREKMLRQSSRSSGGDIYVATLAIVAWTVEDMLECVTRAAERRSTIVALDVGLRIAVDADAALLRQAIVAFNEGRRSRIGGEAGLLGAQVSAMRRVASAKAAAETIRELWGHPSSEYSTADLLAKAGLTLNTVKVYLGPRPAAQRAWQVVQKRRGA